MFFKKNDKDRLERCVYALEISNAQLVLLAGKVDQLIEIVESQHTFIQDMLNDMPCCIGMREDDKKPKKKSK